MIWESLAPFVHRFFDQFMSLDGLSPLSDDRLAGIRLGEDAAYLSDWFVSRFIDVVVEEVKNMKPAVVTPEIVRNACVRILPYNLLTDGVDANYTRDNYKREHLSLPIHEIRSRLRKAAERVSRNSATFLAVVAEYLLSELYDKTFGVFKANVTCTLVHSHARGECRAGERKTVTAFDMAQAIVEAPDLHVLVRHLRPYYILKNADWDNEQSFPELRQFALAVGTPIMTQLANGWGLFSHPGNRRAARKALGKKT